MPDKRTSLNHVAVETGSYGWDYDAWSEDFYPEDLPADWRLAYLANQCRLVVVPVGYVKQYPRDWFEDALDDARADLQLLFELDHTLSEENCIRLADWLELAGEHAVGLLSCARCESIQQIFSGWPIYSPVRQMHLESLDVQVLEPAAGVISQAPYSAVARVSGAGSHELRRLPPLVRKLLPGPVAIVFDGEPPPVQTIQSMPQILDLMGLA